MRKRLFVFGLISALSFASLAHAQSCSGYPYTLTNGQVADASQVMGNFNSILNCVNNDFAPIPVPLSDLTSIPTNTILANNSAFSAYPAALTVSQTMSLLGAAPLASPTFTGIPAAPTAANGTNTTQIATTAFVTASPAIVSPAFSGTPTAPTAAPGTNTTQIATTAFTTAAVTAGAPAAGTTAGAYVNASCTPSGCTINGTSYNVASVTRSAIGAYVVTFTTPFTDAYYVAEVTQVGGVGYANVAGASAGAEGVYLYNGSGTSVDGSFALAVFGK